jgi:hypothetical protein
MQMKISPFGSFILKNPAPIRPRRRSLLCARDSVHSRSFLRSAKISLQKRATLRNAARISLPLVSSELHAAQHPDKLRKSLSLNYKTAALNQLSHAGIESDDFLTILS